MSTKTEQKKVKKIRTIDDLDGFDSKEYEPINKQSKTEIVNEIQQTTTSEVYTDLIAKDALFITPKKDLKRTTGYTLSESLIKKIEIISKKNNISKSEVVDLILKDFFNRNKFN